LAAEVRELAAATGTNTSALIAGLIARELPALRAAAK
jgi:hypothetical protein